MNRTAVDSFRVINQKVSRLEGAMNKKFDNIDNKLSKTETKILVVESKVGDIKSSLSNKIQSVKNELVTDREKNAKCYDNVNSRIDTVCVNVKAMAVDLESRVYSKVNIVDDKVETVGNTVKLHEIETKTDVNELKSTVSELNQKFEIFSNDVANRNFSMNTCTLLSNIPVKNFSNECSLHPVDFLESCRDNFLHNMSENFKIKIIDKVRKPKNYFNHTQRGGDHSWGNTNFNRRENSRPNNYSFHHREQNSHNINNNFHSRKNYNFHSRGQSGNNWNRSNYRESEKRNWREHRDAGSQNAMGSHEVNN
ncbi:uncharacterized protein DDB_G0287625-like [Schistocerca gregaria]|uniref:uncharacterized protein DDB_G0287625-like n=1 Tax=Schistocerca gregaria TaxID=7010 RepID=UPI00211ED368|nr:uncharacterized protein DDB_G0287625-like [Schistocerca gregaria]